MYLCLLGESLKAYWFNLEDVGNKQLMLHARLDRNTLPKARELLIANQLITAESTDRRREYWDIMILDPKTKQPFISKWRDATDPSVVMVGDIVFRTAPTKAGAWDGEADLEEADIVNVAKPSASDPDHSQCRQNATPVPLAASVPVDKTPTKPIVPDFPAPSHKRVLPTQAKQEFPPITKPVIDSEWFEKEAQRKARLCSQRYLEANERPQTVNPVAPVPTGPTPDEALQLSKYEATCIKIQNLARVVGANGLTFDHSAKPVTIIFGVRANDGEMCYSEATLAECDDLLTLSTIAALCK